MPFISPWRHQLTGTIPSIRPTILSSTDTEGKPIWISKVHEQETRGHQLDQTALTDLQKHVRHACCVGVRLRLLLLLKGKRLTRRRSGCRQPGCHSPPAEQTFAGRSWGVQEHLQQHLLPFCAFCSKTHYDPFACTCLQFENRSVLKIQGRLAQSLEQFRKLTGRAASHSFPEPLQCIEFTAARGYKPYEGILYPLQQPTCQQGLPRHFLQCCCRNFAAPGYCNGIGSFTQVLIASNWLSLSTFAAIASGRCSG